MTRQRPVFVESSMMAKPVGNLRGRPDKSVSLSFKQKNQKNKHNKTVLSFDESARDQWLSGFSKRKTERRKRAQREEIERLKEDKKRIKKEKRDERAKELEELRAAVGMVSPTELEVIAKPTVYDMDTHTVTVVDVTDTDFVGSSGLHLGFNSMGDEDEETQTTTAPEQGAGHAEDVDKNVDTDETTKKRRPTNKPKHKGKKRPNLTHLMDKKMMAKQKKLKSKSGYVKRTKSNVKRKK